MFVKRVEKSAVVYFYVMQNDADGAGTDARHVLVVSVNKPEEHFPAGVMWESASDRRPELARALSQALVLAAQEADVLNGVTA